MVIARDLRTPVDSTLPLTAVNNLPSSEYVKKLLHDLQRAYQLARNVLFGCQQHQLDYYDRTAHGASLQPVSSMHLHSPAPPAGKSPKLHKAWSGPYIVQQVRSNTTCRIRGPGQLGMHSFTVHFNNLKPATQGVTVSPSLNRDFMDT
ncbi:uncharacterized protein DEA37_0009886 [Paragonimus westermani]|uniref:Uncharacterized protein n=1 Tax=Paragonimus westermani TaxID=34504 RepID=A0A5J4N818_9TREM|nr:uncharacterized protein DEA37_0009886 [Paragonimus westermani]